MGIDCKKPKLRTRSLAEKIMPSYQARDVVVVYAKRTAIGTFRGGLSSVKAHDLAAAVIKDMMQEIKGVKNEEISEVILGQVLAAGTRSLCFFSLFAK